MLIEPSYNVIAIHPSRECNLSCPFCYRRAKAQISQDSAKSPQFFLDLVPFIKQIAPQVALGGGEPLLDLQFIEAIGKACERDKLTVNVTTNGKRIPEMTDFEIQTTFANIQMVSVSFDYFKWGDQTTQYAKIIHRIKKCMAQKSPKMRKNFPFQIGANLLLDGGMMKNRGIPFLQIVLWLFHQVLVDRIFVLYPKNGTFLDILRIQNIFDALTRRYPQFYVDDLVKQIFEEGYTNWQHPCHYGSKILSIDECGGVYGCSFDTEPLLKLNQPRDLLKVQELSIEPRYECPYFPRNQIKNQIPPIRTASQGVS